MPSPVIWLSTVHPILPRSVDWAESGREGATDDALVAKHRGLNQTPAIIARAALPAYASMFHNRREMFVTRRCGGFTWNGRYPWWNDDRRVRMTLGDSIVDSLTVIRASAVIDATSASI